MSEPFAARLGIGCPNHQRHGSKGRNEINTAAAICQGNGLPEQAAETKQQESVTGTFDKCCSGDAGIRGDVGENRVLEGHRKSSAEGVDHNHGESQHLAASAPVERVLGIIARTGNKLDSVPHLCAGRRRAGNIDEVDGAGHHGRMLSSHPEVCVEVDERALTGESQSSLGTRRNVFINCIYVTFFGRDMGTTRRYLSTCQTLTATQTSRTTASILLSTMLTT